MARLFAEHGIEAILLKGPTLQWAWGDETRPYVDVDLLVAPDDHDRARSVLGGAGFVARPDLAPGHATTLLRDGDAHVDLHWTLLSARVSPDEGWTRLRHHVTSTADDGLLLLDDVATTCVAVLHAARTPGAIIKPATDVQCLVDHQAPIAEALLLAERLDARAAFVRGLCRTGGGRELATSLGVRPPTHPEVVASRAVGKARLAVAAFRARGWSGLARYVWPAAGPAALDAHSRRVRARRALKDLVTRG